MFVDARGIPPETVIDTDLCIVGAGPAGITIALRFIDSPIRISLIESGGFELDHQNQELYEGQNVGLPYCDLHALRSRYFGGSSNCWGGWCRAFDSIDFEKRDWVEHSGWPFDMSVMAPYYERARVLCGLETCDDTPSYWADQIEKLGLDVVDLPTDRVISKIVQISPKRRFGVEYRDRIDAASNVTAYLNANVIDIETDATTTTVDGVQVKTLAQNQFRVTAKRFVLATGGIENPRMMLLSNKVAKNGLGNQNDLVGRFFMEHPRVHLSKLKPTNPKMSFNLYDAQYTFFKSPIAATFALQPEVIRKERLLNYKSWIIAVYRGEESRGGLALKNVYRAVRKGSVPDHFMKTSAGFWLRNGFNLAIDFPRTIMTAAGRLTHSPSLVDRWEFAHFCEPQPNPESRITIGHDKDGLGLNRVDLKWQLSSLDKRTIARAETIIAEEVERAGIGRVESGPFDPTTSDWPDSLLWGWHQMGTTRMHEDPKQGVVDGDCRVHGMSNLYVAGSSVFPTGGSDLPTLTIVALAARLADHLAEEKTPA